MPALLLLLLDGQARADLRASADIGPFRLQLYCNGHSWLARRLTREGIDFAIADNAFVRIADFARAQAFADGLHPTCCIGT